MKQEFDFYIYCTIEQLMHLNRALLCLPKGLNLSTGHFFSKSRPGYYIVYWHSADSANIAAIVLAFTYAWRKNYDVSKERISQAVNRKEGTQ